MVAGASSTTRHARRVGGVWSAVGGGGVGNGVLVAAVVGRQTPCWGSEGTTRTAREGRWGVVLVPGMAVLLPGWGGGGVVGWWWVEICIVDASILVFVVRLLVCVCG